MQNVCEWAGLVGNVRICYLIQQPRPLHTCALIGRALRRWLSSGVAALVQFEVALVSVAFAAPVADVLLAAGVQVPLVRAQVTALTEVLAADVAGVRFLARVNARVQLQAVPVVELLVARAARKRLLARVRAAV